MTLPPPVAAVRRGVRAALADRDPGDVVLVACSGGADSLALLSATVFEGHKLGARVVGAIVDHGLQDDSAGVAARVVAQMASLGADETASIRVRVEVAGMGMEAGARQARYAALGQLAAHVGAPTVLVGHTRDDQAETVLLGLTRGSGGRSIAGMRPAFTQGGVRFVRPLLDVTREQTEAACVAEGIAFWTDPHNADPRFLRSRVRHDVLPVLERQLGPGVAATLARTGEQLRADMEYLDDLAEAAFAALASPPGRHTNGDGPPRAAYDVRGLEQLAAPIRTRVLRLAALAAGCPGDELFAVHVNALADLLVGSARGRQIQLPGHVTAYRDAYHLAFRRTSP